MADIAGILQELLQATQEGNALLRNLSSTAEEQKTATQRQQVEKQSVASSAMDPGRSDRQDFRASEKRIKILGQQALAGAADFSDPFQTGAQAAANTAMRTSTALVGADQSRIAGNLTGFSSAQRVFENASDETRSYFSRLAAGGVPFTKDQVTSFQADAERRSGNVENAQAVITAGVSDTQGNKDLAVATAKLAVAAGLLTVASKDIGKVGKALLKGIIK